MFASMDIFSGEDFYEKHFTFKETGPINDRFAEFGIEDKNFIMNSGSYLIMQLLLIAWHFARKYLHKLGVKYAKFPIFRRLGMMIKRPEIEGLR